MNFYSNSLVHHKRSLDEKVIDALGSHAKTKLT